MKTQIKKSISIKAFIIVLLLLISPFYGNSQIDVNKLTNKSINKLNDKKKDKKKDNKKDDNNYNIDENTNNQSENQENEKKSTIESNLLDEITKEQQTIVADNKTVTDNQSNNYADVTESAYLTFTNNFSDKDANIISFSGKDNIYAKLNLNKTLVELLPKEDASGLQYYRVEIKVTTKEGSNESNVKIREKKHFKLPYGQKNILLAVVPEKAFFESILSDYQKAGLPKTDGYNDILARNFCSVIAGVFKNLSDGQHRVEIEFEVTAKLQSDRYFKLKNMKGVFMLTINQQAKQRFAETQQMLIDLYKQYEQDASNAENTAYLKEQEDKLNNMSIDERNKYLEQQKSTTNGFSDDNFKIFVKSNNTGQSVNVIVTNLSTMSENIQSVQPGKTITLELYKSQRYKISTFGQNSSKSAAIKIADVDKSSDGKTITVK